MNKVDYFEITKLTLIAEIEELEERLPLLKKRVHKGEAIGLGNSLSTSIGIINNLVGKYQVLCEKYE